MTRPILYSFRRCPYAMRARLAIASSGVVVEHREILLRDKPQAFLQASPKGTVPVVVIGDRVIEESLDIMHWALHQNDPENWLDCPTDAHALIDRADGAFKTALDRYKYASRHPEINAHDERMRGGEFLHELDEMLATQPYLYGERPGLADMAIAPFVRQYAHVDLEWFSAQPWPDLGRWLNRFKASKRFQQIMVKQPLWMPLESDGLGDK